MPDTFAPAAQTQSQLSRIFIEGLNRIRNDNNLQQVQNSSELENAASQHARFMAENDTTLHDGDSGSTAPGRIAAAGFSHTPVAEINHSFGPFPAAPGEHCKRVLKDYWKSEGHKLKMMKTEFNRAGVGIYFRKKAEYTVVYWCVTLGCAPETSASSSAASSASSSSSSGAAAAAASPRRG